MKFVRASGRRKTSVAQVLMKPGSGKIAVNNRDFATFFPVEINRKKIELPLDVTNLKGNFDLHILVRGGGNTGQTEAVQLGIARALVEYDESLKPVLREEGLLTRDSRMVERKKYGQKKARKRFQFSKR
jgi:small subunit ribosomal protein S9